MYSQTQHIPERDGLLLAFLLTVKNYKCLVSVFMVLTWSSGAFAARPDVCSNLLSTIKVSYDFPKPKELFKDSKVSENPITIKIDVENWKQIHEEPDRLKANSSAKFTVDGYVFDGLVQARGHSRFTLFHHRTVEFEIGGKTYKAVNRVGGQKADLKWMSSSDQNARVLIEYLAYKLHEIIDPINSVKTRLTTFIFFENGTPKDKGYGFLLETKGQLAKRLDMEQTTSWNYDLDSEDAISGDLFRLLVADGDLQNASQNFIYLGAVKDGLSTQRVPYDFDFSLLAPPHSITLKSIPTLVTKAREKLEKMYEIGATDIDVGPPLTGTAQEQAERLERFRARLLAEC